MHEDIKAYIDGELTPEQAQAVERLLATDTGAKRQEEDFRAIAEAVRAIAADPVPVGLDRAEAAVGRRRQMPWGLALSGVAAVVLLGLVGPRLVPPLGSGGTAPEAQPAFNAAPAGGSEEVASAPALGAHRDVPTASAKPEGLRQLAEQLRGRQVGAKGASTSAPPVLEQNRKVVKSADLEVKVEDAKRALADVHSHTAAMGGYVASSSLTAEAGRPVAYASLRVPSARFAATVAMLRGLGTVVREASSGEDVTAQVADLDARTRTLAAEEQALIEMLRQARRLGDVMTIREKLTQVRSEIESLKAQSATLSNLAALSTVGVQLVQAEVAGEPAYPKDWFEATLASAVNALAAVGRVVVQGLLYALILSPVWLPAALVVRWILRRGSQA
jgi:anti-sigma factor RsiW